MLASSALFSKNKNIVQTTFYVKLDYQICKYRPDKPSVHFEKSKKIPSSVFLMGIHYHNGKHQQTSDQILDNL